MIKILFVIHDLAQGGAEKVLINLVNNMDKTRFDVTVMALFDVGVNRQFLKKEVTYKSCFKHMIRGNSHFMKLLSPKQLHRWLIPEHYDIIVSYLEGPSARVVSGCPHSDTKLVSWIHTELHTKKRASQPFRSYSEASWCYNRFDQTVCVSKTVQEDFQSLFDLKCPVDTLYNTNESSQIVASSKEEIEEQFCKKDEFNLCGVGKLIPIKGFDRLCRIHKRLRDENYPVHTYLLGIGPEQKNLEAYLEKAGVRDSVTFLGYCTNPYKYVAKCDLFVCSSLAEGFSTAATEALIVGTPIVTTLVAGMREMLGEHNEYGIVTENDEEALYQGIKALVSDPEALAHYTDVAKERGLVFSTQQTVDAVEKMLLAL